MLKRKIFVFILCLFVMFSSNMEVLAATTYKLTAGKRIYFSSTGKYCASACGGGHTVLKHLKIDGKDKLAYCTQLENNLLNTEYVETTWTSRNPKWAAIAGKAYHLAKDKWSNADERYVYITLLMNCIVGTHLVDTGQSKNYCHKNKSLEDILEKAKNTYSESINSSLPVPKIKVDNNSYILNATNVANKFVSEKITFSDLKDNYGGGDSQKSGAEAGVGLGDVKYRFSVSGNSLICDDPAGTINCSSSRDVNGPDTVSFYIMMTGNYGDKVTLTVNEFNTSIYYSVRLFKSTKNSSVNQKLIVPGSNEVNRNADQTYEFEVHAPENHQIKITKVDGDNYEQLAGAELQLYRANKVGDNYTKIGDNLNLVKNGDYSFTYDDNSDIFGNFHYCMAETKAPSGYKLLKKPLCFPAERSVTACYENGEKTDDKYCTSTYSCPKDDGKNYELSNGKCNTTEEVEGTPVLGCPGNKPLTGDKCLVSSDASVDPDTNELYCEDGSNVVDGKCISEVEKVTVGLTCPTPTQDPTNTYTPVAEDNKCVRTVSINATCTGEDGSEVDGKFCTNSSNYTHVTPSGNSILVKFPNEKTKVSVSKKAVSGEDELYGAELKICSTKPDANGNCEVVTIKEKGSKCPIISGEIDASDKTSDATGTTNDTNTASNTNNGSTGSVGSSIDDICTYDATTNTRTIKLDWISSDVPKTWSGLEAGKTYYLVEVLPPLGYIPIATSIEFVINEDGSIKAGEKEVSKDLIVVNNQLTNITVSKTDIATSKEISGAVLSICAAAFDDNNNLVMIKNSNDECAIANLADGSEATWVSGKEPHKITGLPIGAYYLVEKLAPNGYTTAESIPFILTKEGKLTDIKGNSLANNKLVMQDKPIKDVKTGSLGTYIVAMILALATIGGFGSYYLLKKQENKIV